MILFFPAIVAAIRGVVGAASLAGRAAGAGARAAGVGARAARASGVSRTATGRMARTGVDIADDAGELLSSMSGATVDARTTNNITTTGSYNRTESFYSTINNQPSDPLGDPDGHRQLSEGWRQLSGGDDGGGGGGGGGGVIGQLIGNAVSAATMGIFDLWKLVKYGEKKAGSVMAGPARRYETRTAFAAAQLDYGRVRRDILQARLAGGSASELLKSQEELERTRAWAYNLAEIGKQKFAKWGTDVQTSLWDSAPHAGKYIGGLSGAVTTNLIDALIAKYGDDASKDTFRDSVPGELFGFGTGPGRITPETFHKEAKKWRRRVGPDDMPHTMQ